MLASLSARAWARRWKRVSTARGVVVDMAVRPRVFSSGEQPETMIDLLKGHPCPSHLPSQKLSKALHRLSARTEAGELLLGYTPTEGPRAFREALSTFISNRCSGDEGARDNTCRMDGLFATGGVSHGLVTSTPVYPLSFA
eukprot:jgi/Bigna1/70947/fgenesh1_pg.14_\